MSDSAARTRAEQATEGAGRRPSAPVVVPTLRVYRVPLPGVHVPSVHVPGVHMPGTGRLMPHVDPRSLRGRALWIGGLGGLAVIGVLDWPVAAAVAAGTWVAEQRARAYVRDETSVTEHGGDDSGRKRAAAAVASKQGSARQEAPRRAAGRRTTTRRAASTGAATTRVPRARSDAEGTARKQTT